VSGGGAGGDCEDNEAYGEGAETGDIEFAERVGLVRGPFGTSAASRDDVLKVDEVGAMALAMEGLVRPGGDGVERARGERDIEGSEAAKDAYVAPGTISVGYVGEREFCKETERGLTGPIAMPCMDMYESWGTTCMSFWTSSSCSALTM
jgi:hypothetical protein